MAIFGRSAIVVDSGESCSVLAGSGGWRAVWCPNQFWAPGAQNPKIFFFENYFFQYSYNVKMRLSAIKSGDSYQIRAERILIPTLCPFWAPDSQFGHRVPNWAPNRPTSPFSNKFCIFEQSVHIVISNEPIIELDNRLSQGILELIRLSITLA